MQTFSIALTGFQSERLQDTALRLAERIERQTGLFLKQPISTDKKTASVIINVKEGAATAYPQVKEDESYSLNGERQGKRLSLLTHPTVQCMPLKHFYN